MPEPKNYILLKDLLDTYGQTEFLRNYGTLDDIHKIQQDVINAFCNMYDLSKPCPQKLIKIKKD